MSEILPPVPPISIGLTVLALAALGLAVLAGIAILTVLLAARRSILPMQQIKSAAVTLLWVAPALALVGMVGATGLYFTRTTVVREDHGVVDEIRPVGRRHRQAARRIVRTVKTQTGEVSVVETGETSPVVSSVTQNQAEIPNTVAADNRNGSDSPVAEGAQQRDARIENRPPTEGVLNVVETRVGAPDWAEKDPQPSDKGVLVSLSSERFATLQEAQQQLTAKAVSYVRDFYHDEYPLSGDWTVPVSLIEHTALRQVVGETYQQDFGSGIQGTMYRAHVQLELNSALRKGIHDSWHGQIVSHRLTVLGSMLGLLTLMLATSAGYFRLDELTGGLYRRRLKFAAASLVAAGSLVALVIA